MKKSFSKVAPKPIEKWAEGQYVCRWNIVELPDVEVVDGKEVDKGVKYEYNEVVVPALTRKAIIDALVAEKYDFADEIALAFSRKEDDADRKEHEAYVVECKAIADEILANE